MQGLDGMLDRMIVSADRILRSLSGVPSAAARPSPARDLEIEQDQAALFDETQRRHAEGLMRVNHTGEVCAQALYEGQALTSRSKEMKAHLQLAANEEQDHLSWCAERLDELGGKPSVLNPAFYAASFLLGSGVGLLDRRIGLGFVSATEDEVCAHLDRHIESLPLEDARSRAVLTAMREEESRHGSNALGAGGLPFPHGVKKLMRLVSKLMTETTYRI